MKILGSDYDGTLNHGGIDTEKKNAISRWRKAGNIFALISGRCINDVLAIYKEKAFECDYIISNNGAVIMKPDGTKVSDVRCKGEIAKPLIECLLDCGCRWCNIETAFRFKVFDDEKDCNEKGDCILEKMPQIPYFNQINVSLQSVERAAEVTAIITEKFGNWLNPLQNGNCIDIVHKDIDKAKGLYILAELVGGKHEDIIAVGDNINDRQMIAEFRSYAMENGVEEIKALADYITKSVTDLIYKELI